MTFGLTKKIDKYEIINHGPEHAQYWQGCGVTFTEYDDCSTGIGDNAKEAYLDALEQVAQYDIDVEQLPENPKGIRKRDKVPSDCAEDYYWYVSIRVKYTE